MPVVAPDIHARLQRATFRAENTASFALTAFSTSSAIVSGDLNCDGVVDFGDINPFVLALSDPAGYAAAFPDCNILSGDS